MLCLPQKLRISCVSAILSMSEPERLRRERLRRLKSPKARTACGLSNAPTTVILPSRPSNCIGIDIVLRGDGVEDKVESAGVLIHLPAPTFQLNGAPQAVCNGVSNFLWYSHPIFDVPA